MHIIHQIIEFSNPVGAETWQFWENYVSTMVADAMSSPICRSSAAMILNLQNNGSLPSIKKDFNNLSHNQVKIWQKMQMCCFIKNQYDNSE